MILWAHRAGTGGSKILPLGNWAKTSPKRPTIKTALFILLNYSIKHELFKKYDQFTSDLPEVTLNLKWIRKPIRPLYIGRRGLVQRKRNITITGSVFFALTSEISWCENASYERVKAEMLSKKFCFE